MERKRLLKVVKEPTTFNLDSEDSFLLRNYDENEKTEKHDQIRTKELKKAIIEDQKGKYNPKYDFFDETDQEIGENLDYEKTQPNDRSSDVEESTHLEDLDYDSINYSLDYEKSVYVDGARVGKVGGFFKTLLKKAKQLWPTSEKPFKQNNDILDIDEPIDYQIRPNDVISPVQTMDGKNGVPSHEDKKPENVTNHILEQQKNAQNDHQKFETKTRIENFLSFISNKKAVILIFFITILSIIYNFKLSKTKGLLQLEIENLRNDLLESKEVHIEKETFHDIAKIGNGTTITAHPAELTWGFIWKRKGANVLSILSENFDTPFLFKGSIGTFTFNFSGIKKINSIGLVYPEEVQNTSAIKDFSIETSEQSENFSYNTPEKFQEFSLSSPIISDSLVFKILTNHGNKKCTSVYKIYIFATNAE
ncbi:Spindle pole body protein [Pseudoloma neurophilia]|uniref:Spindle pole body protein n=1 Tax=Pseudoloma neurophilia TaxID=146866 RepID=A0A0R0M157_9MICR|nr:Spindle pole body protein [Pseudoloma neurophilia]